MAITVYKSTDGSAPVLTGQVGSLVALLDAILVNGYGAKASQGWSKPYTGTNAAVFRMPAGTNRRYLRVDDNSPPGGTARVAAVRGYEAMTALSVGSGAFPTELQLANSVSIAKSLTADATTRAWLAIGDGRFFYLFTQISAVAIDWYPFAFGDFTRDKLDDQYNTLLMGNQTVSVDTTANNLNSVAFGSVDSSFNSVQLYHYMPRSWNQIGGAVPFGKTASLDSGQMGNGTVGSTGIAYPAPHNNGYYVKGPFTLLEGGVPRGVLPGLYGSVHSGAVRLGTGAEQNAVVRLPGKTLLVVDFKGGPSPLSYECAIDITGPWA